jgi:L-ribulose-5-phosphate 4-epimerase
MGKYTDLKERVYIANMQVPAHKLAIFTWGNVSAIDRAAGVMAIKPSGVAYDKLTPLIWWWLIWKVRWWMAL